MSGPEVTLPVWAEMTDLDKGAALLHLHKRDWEGAEYAEDNYPARYFDHPALTALSRSEACRHAVSVEGDADLAGALGGDEYTRLYELALAADEARWDAEREARKTAPTVKFQVDCDALEAALDEVRQRYRRGGNPPDGRAYLATWMKSANDVPRLLAALDEVLRVASGWDEKGREADVRAAISRALPDGARMTPADTPAEASPAFEPDGNLRCDAPFEGFNCTRRHHATGDHAAHGGHPLRVLHSWPAADTGEQA